MEIKKLWKNKLPDVLRPGNLKKDRLLIALLVGILLLVITIPTGKGNGKNQRTNTGNAAASQGAADGSDYAAYLENRLEELLSQMEGVGDASVMVTLASSAEKVVEKDVERQSEKLRETDSQGGERMTDNSQNNETTVYEEADGAEGTPYVSKEITPRVEGVVVTASGGDDPRVVKNITEAVQALFGIETHKIRIVKKN